MLCFSKKFSDQCFNTFLPKIWISQIALFLGSVQFTKWRKYEMKRNRPFLLEIQNTKWKNPIYEMKKSNLRNETFLYYYWKYPKYEMEKSNLRNETFLYYYWKYAKYEMTKVTKRNVQFTKWTCGFQKISNLWPKWQR